MKCKSKKQKIKEEENESLGRNCRRTLLVKDRLDIELHGKETNGPHLMMSAV